MTLPSTGGHLRLAASAAVVFVATGLVASTGILPGEVGLTRALNALPTLVIDALELVMQLGTRPAILLIAAVAVAVAPGPWWRVALTVVVAGALSWVLSDVAKDVVERPRPAAYSSEIEVYDHASGFGWPSTHTAIASGALVAAALVARRRPTGALALAGGVGVARMAVGVHLPLDVVGGLALGVAVAATTVAVISPGGRGRR